MDGPGRNAAHPVGAVFYALRPGDGGRLRRFYRVPGQRGLGICSAKRASVQKRERRRYRVFFYLGALHACRSLPLVYIFPGLTR